MKKRAFKKLTLKKSTVASLNGDGLAKVKGGTERTIIIKDTDFEDCGGGTGGATINNATCVGCTATCHVRCTWTTGPTGAPDQFCYACNCGWA